jgi:NAD(P)-dependent dehydrogenase (short-subunit alcohol dehydrogenase family)
MSTEPGKKLDTSLRRQGDVRGIALARACLDAGFTVHVAGCALPGLQQGMTTLAGTNDRLACQQPDQRDPFAVNALHGAPDLVASNAGVQYRKPFIDIASELFEQVWKLSCYAGFLVGQAAARPMLPRQNSSIIFSGATASILGASAFASAIFGLRAVAASWGHKDCMSPTW